MSEKAKAVQEVSKTAKEGIDALKQTGSFLKNVFGDGLIDAVGVISDKIKFY